MRTFGGYVVAPPSQRADGRAYSFASAERRPVTASADLIERLALRRACKSTSLPRLNTQSLTRYVRAAVDGERRRVARAPRGGRNTTLCASSFRLGQFVGANALSEGAVISAMMDACVCNALIKDDGQARVLDTISRAVKAGAAQPRELPAKEAGGG